MGESLAVVYIPSTSLIVTQGHYHIQWNDDGWSSIPGEGRIVPA
jgi:hypothetical protein